MVKKHKLNIFSYVLVLCQVFILIVIINRYYLNRYYITKLSDNSFSQNIKETNYGNLFVLDGINQIDEKVFEIKKSEAEFLISDKKVNVVFSGNYSIVDISEQRNYVYKDDKPYKIYKISTGGWLNTGYDSKSYPNIWKITWRQDEGLTPLYGSCLLGLDVYKNGSWLKTDRAMHGTDTPGNLGLPMSLGCVYHSNKDIEDICSFMDIGDIMITID